MTPSSLEVSSSIAAIIATNPPILASSVVHVLIADDLQDNLNIVQAILTYKGYSVATAKNGKQVLERAAERAPDLFLLDIQMPEMNGFEACRLLKAQERFRDTPVMFLTAKTDSYDILEGFKYGAVDYITKPFNTMELVARVQTHLELKRSRDLLAARNGFLEKMSVGLQKLQNETTEFMSIVVHDLKSPLMTIRGLADLLRQEDGIPPSSMKVVLTNIVKSAERMFSIIKNLQDVSAIESGKFSFDAHPLEVSSALLDMVAQHEYTAGLKDISLTTEIQPEASAALIKGNSNNLLQIFDNLLSNAIKFSPVGSTVALRLYLRENAVSFDICDEGSGINEADRQNLFTKFSSLAGSPSAGETSSGLGLYIVKKFTEAMNGTIEYEPIAPKGSMFTVTFPVVDEDSV